MSMSIPPGTWRIGRLGGVDLLIKPSIVLMGVVLVALFAPRFDDRSQSNPYALAAAFVIALYVSVPGCVLSEAREQRPYRGRQHAHL